VKKRDALRIGHVRSRAWQQVSRHYVDDGNRILGRDALTTVHHVARPVARPSSRPPTKPAEMA